MKFSVGCRWRWLLVLALGLMPLSAAAQEGSDAADAVLRSGDSAYAKGNKKEAVRHFAEFLEKYPNDKRVAEVMVALGAAQQELGDREAAVKTLGALLAKFPQSPLAAEAAHRMARMLLKDGKPGEALAAVEKTLPNAGQSPLIAQLLMDQADAVFDLPDRRKEAAALYAAVAAKHPQDPLAPVGLYQAAYASLHVGANDQAVKYAEEFLAAHAGHKLAVDARHIAAEGKLLQKQYAEAEKLFADLAAKNPTHADAAAWKVRRGTALALQAKHAEAVAALSSALKDLKAPAAIAEAQFILAASQAELKQFDAAAKALEAALNAAPKGPKAAESLALLGQFYLQTKNDAKAKAAVARLAAAFPDSALLEQARYRLAEAAFAASDWKGAAAEYQTVCDKWPQGALAPYARLGLGLSLVSAKDYEGAEKAFDALLEKNPEPKLALRARHARASVRQQLGKFAPALEDWQALLASDPPAAEKSDARYAAAACRYGLRQYAEAAKVLQEILKDDPLTPIADKVYYDLAWAQKEQKLEKEAAENFAACAAAKANGPLAAECLYHVGEFAYAGNDFAKAAANYYAAMQKAGKSELGEKAAHKLGWSYFHDDKTGDAQKTFAYQRATWPQGLLGSDAAFMEGECFFKLKQYANAVKAYDQVKNPTDARFGITATLHKAQSLGKLNKWADSAKLLADVAKDAAETPYAVEATYEHGVAMKNLGKPADAQALFEKVVAQSQTGNELAAKAQFMIGEVQLQEKKYPEAVKSFVKVAYGYGYPQWQAVAMYEAGRALEASGKKDEAIKQYRELVEKFPAAAEFPLAAERLKVLEK